MGKTCAEPRNGAENMRSIRTALVAVTVALSACATTLPPPEPEPPSPAFGPLSKRSLPGDYGVAMLGVGAVAAMSAKSAGAALRPATAEHVLWKPSSFRAGSVRSCARNGSGCATDR
jgi:hypothetical protein